jgi:hypothetical protein
MASWPRQMRIFHPLHPAFESRDRVAFWIGVGLIAIGMTVLALPIHVLGALGWIHQGNGTRLLPAPSFYVGSACLLGSIWAAARAVRGTRAQRLAMPLLGVICLAQFGEPFRDIMQLSALHRFYLPVLGASPKTPFAVSYWGLTIFSATVVGFAACATVVVANLTPRKFCRAWLRRRVERTSQRGWWLALPVGSCVLVAIVCGVVPLHVASAMGYTAPGVQGGRVSFSVDVLNEGVWDSFARLAFLPLLVGMWEGMESARACVKLTDRWNLRHVPAIARDYRALTGLATVAAVVGTVLAREPWLALGAIVIGAIIVLSDVGMPLFAMPTLGRSSRLGLGEDWQSAAPIAQFLAVLAAPVYVPLLVDLWRGLEGPFRLLSDAGNYVDFWRPFGLAHVPEVSIGGIFGHGTLLMAEYGLGLAAFLVIGVIFNVLFIHDDIKGIGKSIGFLLRVAATAAALIPILAATTHAYVAVLIGAYALPAVFVIAFVDRSFSERVVQDLVPSLVLLGCWSYVVWHYVWLPPFGVLAATILWRFVLDAGSMNRLERDAKMRRVAGFAALALTGLGLLVLDHGGTRGVFSSLDFADITDRIAVAVIAPIWLVHILVQRQAKASSVEPSKTPALSGARQPLPAING